MIEWKEPQELKEVKDETYIVIITKRGKTVFAKKRQHPVFGACAYVGRGYVRNIIAFMSIPEYNPKLNNMEYEDFVTYKQALELKRVGFDWKCNHYYTKDNAADDEVWLATSGAANWNEDDAIPFNKPICSAPTLALAQKWLRELKKIIIFSKCEFIDEDTLIWTYTIYQYIPEGNGRCKDEVDFWNIKNSFKGCGSYYGDYPTYEAALSAGIDAVLELLTK